ncbi:MAG: two-component regulator propeller domain-containing protein [Vicinamibacteraceae bacterium]
MPIRTYTTIDRLASDRIANIVRDPRGFLWFCTANGVSRFDGERFTTYGPDTGLPHPSINDLLVTRGGRYLLASNGGGIIELDVSLQGPSASRRLNERALQTGRDAWRFRTYHVGREAAVNRVNVLLEDGQGRIWAGTDGGLFMLERWSDPVRFVRVPLFGSTPDSSVLVWSFAESPDGSLWIGTAVGLARRLPDGRVVHYRWPGSPGRVLALAQDRAGRVWVGHDQGLSVLVSQSAAALDAQSGSVLSLRPWDDDRGQPATVLPHAAGHVMSWTGGDSEIPAPVTALALTSNGRVWLAGADRLVEFDGRRFQSFEAPLGGLGSGPTPLSEGIDGHIWAGTLVDGALRFAPTGLVTFTEAEGTRDAFVNTFATRRGRRCAFTAASVVSCYDGRRFVVIGSPSSWRAGGLAGMRAVLEDRAGEWWVATGAGLHRFPPGTALANLARTRPLHTYGRRDGFAADNIAKLYEDTRGDIWIATLDASRLVVARWERATGRLVTYSDADGLPAFHRPLSFAEDRSRAVWIGFREGGLARYKDGRFEILRDGDGIPAGDWVSVHVDRFGRLWVATAGGGVLRVDRPDHRPLDGVRYTTAQGLSTNQVLSLAEDRQGRIYLGTTQGLNRLDPSSGRVRRYTRSDGLSASQVAWEAFLDRQGALWFRGGGGLSRLVPVPDRPTRPPHVTITGALVGEDPAPLSALGEPVVALGTVPGQGAVQIDFAASSFETGGQVRYQYKLEGADENWSPATLERNVRFARLAPGDYRLLVRASGPDGVVSPRPASVTFRVLPPIWQRWWFVALAAASAALLAYTAHRYRVGQLLALERIRSRIATDLHDEVGSSLSQIAVLSEVARRRLSGAETGVTEPLARIADVSRESVGAMSEIVWAVDPERDTIVELEHRMRRFANDVLAARDITVRFPASDAAERISAAAHIRREVFLIFKEAINNIVRHANATEVHIDFHVRRHRMALTVADNGRGLDGAGSSYGLGLRSMRERARRLGGELTITSENGAGTRVSLNAPLIRRGH